MLWYTVAVKGSHSCILLKNQIHVTHQLCKEKSWKETERFTAVASVISILLLYISLYFLKFPLKHSLLF